MRQKEISLKEKLYIKSERDGLTEMFAGIFLFFYSDLLRILLDFSREKKIIVVFIIFFAFSAPIIKKIRKFFTYADIGYVEVKLEMKPIFLYFVVFPLAFYPLFIGLVLNVFKQDNLVFNITKFSTIGFGIIFFFLYFSMYKTLKKVFFIILSLLSLSGGMILFFVNNQLNNEGYMIFLVFNGLLLLMYGFFKFFKLITYSKKYKKDQ